LNSQELKFNLRRLERLSEVRRAFVAAAEAGYREVEQQVRSLESATEEVTRRINAAQENMFQTQRTTSDEILTRENFIRRLRTRAAELQRELDEANDLMETRRAEWTEAKREQRIVEQLHEKRMRDWKRHDDASKQNTDDDTAISRHARRLRNP
jgi:flagellar export protein FliJ